MARTCALGSQPMINPVTKQIKVDEKGNPIWKMPDPASMVRHFINAAMKRKYKNGEVSLQAATHQVPVYKGMAWDLYKYLMRGYHRQQKGRWAQ